MAADNASTDRTADLLRSWSRNAPLTLVGLDHVGGSLPNFRRLLDVADGSFIAFADQDDIWERPKLMTLHQFAFEQQLSLVYSDMSIIDEQGRAHDDSFFRANSSIHIGSGSRTSCCRTWRAAMPACSLTICSVGPAALGASYRTRLVVGARDLSIRTARVRGSTAGPLSPALEQSGGVEGPSAAPRPHRTSARTSRRRAASHAEEAPAGRSVQGPVRRAADA